MQLNVKNNLKKQKKKSPVQGVSFLSYKIDVFNRFYHEFNSLSLIQ